MSPELPSFVPGRELSRIFYQEAVQPILARRFPDLVYGAALLHTGSDVFGFDTPLSMDHHWGPKTELYLTEIDLRTGVGDEIRRMLGEELPFEIRGYPTHFGSPEVPGGRLERSTQRPINHAVRVYGTPSTFLRWYLGVDPLRSAPLHPAEWLTIPEQHLLTITAGLVFHDGTGELTRARDTLRWYPHDVWLYLLAAQWHRISQEEAFMGRCGEVGDELGSRLVAGRLVREVMRLAFLMERQYAPYAKWFGTAFSRLASAARLAPVLEGVVAASSWQQREGLLGRAYERVAEMHNDLKITEPVPPRATHYFSRHYLVIGADRFSDAIRAVIQDPAVRSLPAHLGSTTQWADSTDLLAKPDGPERLRTLYAVKHDG